MFVASEALQKLRGHAGLASRKPWLVAFCFGLLHGLGFAGALAQVGLPQNAIPLALLFFNVGVEIGQLLFIAGILLLGSLCKRMIRSNDGKHALLTAATYAIGVVASFWVFERIATF